MVGGLMTIKVTHLPSGQEQTVPLSTAMIVYGISPIIALQLDAGFVMGNKEYKFECIERLQ